MTWAPDYLTTAELKGSLRIEDAVDDAELPGYVSAASRAIDDHCNRQFGLVAAPEQRFYTARWNARRWRWVVDIDDLMTVVGLVVLVVLPDGTTVAVTAANYTLEPRNAAAEGRPWTRLMFGRAAERQPDGCQDGVAVTGSWGWSAIPAQVKQAAKLQGARFAARRDSPFGIAGSPDTGGELRLLARVDPDVAVSLRGLVRPRKAG